jgi:hypothetical protein
MNAPEPHESPWVPRPRHVLALVVAFFGSIVVLRPLLNGESDARFLASAAWLFFVAFVTIRMAIAAVR